MVSVFDELEEIVERDGCGGVPSEGRRLLEDLQATDPKVPPCPVCGFCAYLYYEPALGFVVACTWNDRHWPVEATGGSPEEAKAAWVRVCETVPDEVRGAKWDFTLANGVYAARKPIMEMTLVKFLEKEGGS